MIFRYKDLSYELYRRKYGIFTLSGTEVLLSLLTTTITQPITVLLGRLFAHSGKAEGPNRLSIFAYGIKAHHNSHQSEYSNYAIFAWVGSIKHLGEELMVATTETQNQQQ